MPSYIPAKVSTQFIFFVSLVSQANTKIMQVNPTIASGDFKVSIDGGALANLGTVPAVTPAGSTMVKITLSTSEMAGANATVVCLDAAGAEWCDLTINIPTAARQIDDLAFPATSGRSMVVDAAGLVDSTTVKQGPSGTATAQTARDLGASVLLSPGTGTGQLDITSGVTKANVTQWLGTAASTPTVAGVPNVNAKTWNDLTTVALPLVPTTAGRMLDVTTTGEAGVDWANVGAPTTTVDLSGTTIKTSQVVGSVSGAVGSVTAGVTLAASAVQAIWDALTSALTTVGSIGKKLADWTIGTAQTGDSYARLGAPAGASVSADIAAVKVDTAAVKVQTDKLAFTVANQVDSNVLDWKSATAPAMTGDAFARLGAPAGASIAADVAAVQADTDNLQTRTPAALVGGRMDASVGTIAAGGLTQIKTQVTDGLAVDTYAEPAAVPAATVSLAAKIGWLFTLGRNRIEQTATVQTVKNDAQAADIATAAVSDNGTTAVRDEFV